MKLIKVSFIVLFFLFCYGCGKAQNNSVKDNDLINEQDTIQYLSDGILGTYSSPPRRPNGKVDAQKLIFELEEIHANTYNWLIWRGGERDFAGLKHFLPMAHKAGLKVWVTLVPPSEPPASEPYGLNYEKWAKKLAHLSKKYSNFVAWSIDDFVHNLDFFTPDYVEKMVSLAHSINPKFAFIPCVYYRYINRDFAKEYARWFDGVLFPYRAASSDNMNLKDPSLVKREVAHFRELFGSDIPIIIDVYASAHSSLGSTTPEYVKTVVNAGLKYADGVMIYTNQDPVKNKEKYYIIKKTFKNGFQ